MASAYPVHQISDEIRSPCRRPTLVATANRQPVACRPRLSPSFRRGPCIRPNCPASLTGEEHPGYVLYGREKGRRFSVYVPEESWPDPALKRAGE